MTLSNKVSGQRHSPVNFHKIAVVVLTLMSFCLLWGCSAQKTTSHDTERTEQAEQQESRETGKTAHLTSRHRLSAPLMADAAYAYVSGSQVNRENYQHIPAHGVMQTHRDPLSTFSIDVDTGSYSNVRRMLNQGTLPPTDAIRIEEMLNYFDYQYQQQANTSHPFMLQSDVSVSPWNPQRVLLRIGLKAQETERAKAQPKNLVLLLDVSGSIQSANKLPLLKRALGMMLGQMNEHDRVSIVVYAGASGVVLPSTPGDQRLQIETALNNLTAGGATNGGQGIELAYKLARESFIEQGINRVVLATDGDFNLGLVDHQQLIDLVVRNRESGIGLTTLGFGQGNYNDHLVEQLANQGNGSYAYIDNLNEARKVLVTELNATLETVAKDVKIQVEFNPDTVAEYRLIGYENRALNPEDFSNDKVDAGEIGAGHTVTALYELTLTGDQTDYPELRYGDKKPTDDDSTQSELALVKLRYKLPKQEHALQMSQIIKRDQLVPFESQSSDYQFAVAVMGFAQKLKHSPFSDVESFQQIIDLALASKGQDEFGYRAEFINLVRMANELSQVQNTQKSTGR